MPNSTSRLALVQPIGADAASELRVAITANATTLDPAVLQSSGTISSRPSAGSVQFGNEYYATDTAQWFKSNGSVWQMIPTGSPARAYKSTAGTITGPGFVTLSLDTVTFDPASCITGGHYVCPAPGYYLVAGQTSIVSTTAAGFLTITGIAQNGTTVSQGSAVTTATPSVALYTNVTDIIQCASGDTLALQCNNNQANPASLVVSSGQNYLSVQPL